MANPFVKAWKYLMALFNSKIDEYADPKVQIQQAIEEAQRQHQALTQQAAQVIGNQRQLEMRLNRQLADIEKLQVNVRQALTLADQATAAGDAAKATEYNNAAEAFAAQLVTAEQSVEDLKALHDQALQAAGQAKKAVEQNAMVLQQKIAERTKLLSQLEQAKMQEQVSASLRSMSEIAAPGQHPEPRRGARQDRAPLRQRDRAGRAGAELGAGPDARGRSRPACRWPGIPGWSRSARRCAVRRCRPAARRAIRGCAEHSGSGAHGRAHREAPRSVENERVDGGDSPVAFAAWRTLLHARPRHGQRLVRAGGPEDQRRHRSACQRQLRRRRRALRWGLFFSVGCVFWGAVTAICWRRGAGSRCCWRSPADRGRRGDDRDTVAAPLPLAEAEPLPAQRPANIRRLPPPGSAARPAMYALGASERGFFSLLGVMERGNMLPDDRDPRADRGGQQDLGRHGGHRRRGGVDGARGQWHAAVTLVSGAHDQRVHRAAERRRASVQRNGHRRSAIGVIGERRSRCRARRCRSSATATSWPVPPIVWSAGRRRSTNSAGYPRRA